MLTTRGALGVRLSTARWLPRPRLEASVDLAMVLLTVAASAVFAARLANHLIEGQAFADAAHGPVIATAAAPPVAVARSAKDGQAIVDRNMFCGECGPTVGPEPPVGVAASISLPLELVATHVAGTASQATVRNTVTDAQGGYWIGHVIPGAGTVIAIRHRSIDVRDLATGRIARVELGGAAPTVKATSPVAAAPAIATDARVRQVDEHTFEIDARLIQDVLAGGAPTGIRVVPSTTDGVSGFRVATLAGGSIYATIGLARGDTIRAVNGLPLDTLDHAMAAVGKLRDARGVELDVMRAGKPVTLRYTIH